MTLADLVSHKTGVPRNDFLWLSKLGGLEQTPASLLNRITYFPPAHDFRTDFTYNNWMWFAAGEVAARASRGGFVIVKLFCVYCAFSIYRYRIPYVFC